MLIKHVKQLVLSMVMWVKQLVVICIVINVLVEGHVYNVLLVQQEIVHFVIVHLSFLMVNVIQDVQIIVCMLQVDFAIIVI